MESEQHMVGNGSGARAARRSFLSRVGAGFGVLGVTLAAGEAPRAQSAGGAAWLPARHAQDDWLDQVPGKHRLVFDTTTPAGLGAALRYANNFFYASQSGYGLGNADTAVVIIVRHNSTPFAFTDAMWKKYGAQLAQEDGFQDPKTKRAPTVNVFNGAESGGQLPNFGVTIDSLVKRGAHFAVCQMATRRLAGTIAETGAVDGAYNELVANLIANAHVVPAGIVALNRAQERGYAVAIPV